VERVDLASGFYLVSRPVGYTAGDRPPLIVCLHETDTGAGTILEFWRGLKSPIGVLLAAPEHHMPGWREADMPCIRAMIEHLRQNVSYDPKRVLLTGYSAGGAMAFYLLYAESFPATAVAATANYVPPTITAKMIAARRDVPIFYAVGQRDINHDRMKSSIELLQANGGTLTLLRPDIGHALDPVVAQQAMDWFIETTTQRLLREIDQAGRMVRTRSYAAGLAIVEPIVGQRRWHLPQVVSKAEAALAELERPGREDLARAERLLQGGAQLDALDLLRRLGSDYGLSRLGTEARGRRDRLEGDPTVCAADRARRDAQQEQAGTKALVLAQRLAAQRQYEQARQQCYTIIRAYPGTAAAARARTLLEQLRRAGK
jgi:hypothetical protein